MTHKVLRHPLEAKPVSRVYVLYTGGTFGMTEASVYRGDMTPLASADKSKSPIAPSYTTSDSSAAAPVPGSNPTDVITALVPSDLPAIEKYLYDRKLLASGIQITIESISPCIDSSSITPHEWTTIANKIYNNYNDHDGFVVIHGTDTMAYTTSALSFIFDHLTKPVVVTGSSQPIFCDTSDAMRNYCNAVRLASGVGYEFRPPTEVMLLFGNVALRGNRAHKFGKQPNIFISPCFPALVDIDDNDTFTLSYHASTYTQPSEDLNVWGVDTGIIDIALFPGITGNFIRRAFDSDDVSGAVLRSWGSGNGPSGAEFIQALSDVIKQGKHVINITQCLAEMVRPGKYASGNDLVRSGVISGGDMTPEAALTKLSVAKAIPHLADHEAMIRYLTTSQRGEMS